jgi:hypothetical protein
MLDGFINPTSRSMFDLVMARECPFKTSPVTFLRMVMAMRRKGQSFRKSHFGRILNGELVTREHFREEKVEINAKGIVMVNDVMRAI